MLKPDILSIEVLMKRFATKLVSQAAKNTNDDAAYIKQFFGFLPQDVEGIHTHRDDEGDGVWFRLKDGRVFDRHGRPSSANHALYDKA
jgi:hypothetical protein